MKTRPANSTDSANSSTTSERSSRAPFNTIHTDTVYLFSLQSGSQVRLYVDNTDTGVIMRSPVSTANVPDDEDADLVVDGQPAVRREVLKHVNPQAVVTAEEIVGPLSRTSG